MRSSALPVYVANRNLNDRSSIPRCQRGNEAVQLSVEWHLLEHLATVRFERSPEIVNAHPAQLRHQPVGAARRNAPEPQIIAAALSPAADNVIAVGNLLEEHGNIGGIVLQVAIHGDNVIPTRMVEACSQSGSLPEVASQFHYRHSAVDGCNLA